MKTYNDIYLSIRNILRQKGIENAGFEAKYLLACAAEKNLSQFLRDIRLYTTEEIENKAMEYVSRRIKGEPLAYITNSWEFYGLPMYINQDVLIPRIDTEIIVDAAIELLTGNKMDARVLDLCCGSGCIACAVGHEMPATRLVAVDISPEALDVCRTNIRKNNLSSRAICMQADACAAPPLAIGSFDMIISNPPYITSGEISELDSSVRDYEPLIALDGGEDGLEFYRQIIKHWRVLLNPGGYILFEVGEGQAEAVCEMLRNSGFSSVGTRRDTIGVDRVVIGRI